MDGGDSDGSNATATLLTSEFLGNSSWELFPGLASSSKRFLRSTFYLSLALSAQGCRIWLYRYECPEHREM